MSEAEQNRLNRVKTERLKRRCRDAERAVEDVRRFTGEVPKIAAGFLIEAGCEMADALDDLATGGGERHGIFWSPEDGLIGKCEEAVRGAAEAGIEHGAKAVRAFDDDYKGIRITEDIVKGFPEILARTAAAEVAAKDSEYVFGGQRPSADEIFAKYSEVKEDVKRLDAARGEANKAMAAKKDEARRQRYAEQQADRRTYWLAIGGAAGTLAGSLITAVAAWLFS